MQINGRDNEKNNQRLHAIEFGVGEEEGFGALGVEVDFDLVVLRDFVTIDTEHGALAEDTMRHAVAGFPRGSDVGRSAGDGSCGAGDGSMGRCRDLEMSWSRDFERTRRGRLWRGGFGDREILSVDVLQETTW